MHILTVILGATATAFPKRGGTTPAFLGPGRGITLLGATAFCPPLTVNLNPLLSITNLIWTLTSLGQVL